MNEAPEGLDVWVDTMSTGALGGSVELKGPTGTAVIAIDVEIIPQVTQTSPNEPTDPQTSRGATAPSIPADQPKERSVTEGRQQTAQLEATNRRTREEADRQARKEADGPAQELATRYALACDLANAQDWDQAVILFTTVADVDPGYRDVQQCVEDARKQQQIARSQAEARRLYQAEQWAAVVEVGQRLHALDPTVADPDGLVTSARAELAAGKERARASQSTVTRIHAPAVDVPALAEALRLWYENQDLEAIVATASTACLVQCRKRRTSKRESKTNALLTVILHSEGEDLVVEFGSAKWLGKAALGVGLAVAWWPLAAVAGASAYAGALRRQKLITQTISFLCETVPTYLDSA